MEKTGVSKHWRTAFVVLFVTMIILVGNKGKVEVDNFDLRKNLDYASDNIDALTQLGPALCTDVTKQRLLTVLKEQKMLEISEDYSNNEVLISSMVFLFEHQGELRKIQD